MSTRAKIGIVNADKTVTSIHLWRDGYPEYAGQILTTKYKSVEQIEKLMKNGNLIDLDDTPDRCSYEESSKSKTHASLEHFFNIKEHDVDYIYFFDNGWHYIALHQ